MEALQQTNSSSVLSKALGTYPNSAPVPITNPDTFTENGAPAFSCTCDLCLNLFASSVRGTPEEKMITQLSDAWSEDKKKALAILLHLRDCRKGKGEKTITYFGLLWLRETCPATYLLNLPVFVDHGYFKDLCYLVELLHQRGLAKLGSTTWIELEYLAELFQKDMATLQTVEAGQKVPITLVGKWLPSEKTHFDDRKNGNQAWLLAHLLFPEVPGASAMRKYRKSLGQCRENLKVVEKLMSAKRFSEINFATLPSKAHRLLRKAFTKNAAEAYAAYLQKLQEGKVKINSTGTQPHELVNTYLTKGEGVDQTIEGQWRDILQKLRASGTLEQAMAISDVSGSMAGLPMEVSVALGILLSELVEGPFHKKLVTFSAEPTLHQVKGETLFDQVQSVQHMPWGMNTNLLAVFKLLVSVAQMHQVPVDKMVKVLFIFTDMQFDAAESKPWLTTYQVIQEMYADAGYQVPNIVFWNLRATETSFPSTADTPGVALVSGFSAELLKVFMSGDITDMTPAKVMNLTLAPYLELVQVHTSDL